MSSASTSIEVLVKEWLRLDKNEATSKEIQVLWEEGRIDELDCRLRKRIEFGTAGLRGKMEAGFSRMNDLTIIQASQGLCAYILANVPAAAERGIVIGHDHRHNSEKWAMITAAVFMAQNMKVHLLTGHVHTPMVPFSLKRLHAACGVMITASHNPKSDNGYKASLLGKRSSAPNTLPQIIEPHDKRIAKSIEANLEPGRYDLSAIPTSSLCTDVTERMHEDYVQYVKALLSNSNEGQRSEIRVVNTSMHGVSHVILTKVFESLGLPEYTSVKEQELPDPDFPTVKFPNPEEKGALDLAMKCGDEVGTNYVLAQDPDADRFAAAERRPNGEWVPFTGDQLGTLFAAAILQRYRSSGKPFSKLAMVASTVSSKMIAAMAASEGFRFVDCLTGFKYIGNTALALVIDGFDVPFGYEEAIGFMFGDEVRDKDGIAATIVFVDLVISLHAQGKTAYSYLQELYQRYGYFQTSNSYFICTETAIINKIFARLRKFPGNIATDKQEYPKEIAGLTIIQVRDLTTGYDSANPPSYKPTLPLSSGHMIQFKAESPSKDEVIFLTLRTSGTEPKIKYYLEGRGQDAYGVGDLLARVVAELGQSWLQAEQNGLGRP
ncbi:Phosphoglucomutase, first 3 domain-containing protein [Neolentinus lepideus HHB14362 ss-1]|uniref:Phosphoglucomutase, first 3 domain-containing protein n=1 Tax=Neolentinus lepideus HHB14362 ss-1 TaxID=1314782 RepID=A0A165T9J9_9AGAM|nr:Phosphoglucomutase, first 3 domain-containing protein [Neolentinus lepideus HHB14362 ss-1]